MSQDRSTTLQALVNGRVLLNAGFVEGKAVLIGGGRIVDILDEEALRDIEPAIHDLRGASLVPGFIDVQVNGGGGVLFNAAPTVESLRTIAQAHRRHGTTGLLPTLISDEADVMRAAIDAVRTAIAQNVPGVLGIHLEGPYLAPERRGVHDAGKFRTLDAREIELAGSLRNGKTLLTLAPERNDLAAIRELTRRGVIVAAGHTAADYAGTRAALAAGLRGFTHLYNAMPPLGSREPGVVGAALEDSDSWVGIIADGHHVHPASLRIALAAKPRGKVFLVTDAMPPVGSGVSTFAIGGTTATVNNGRLAMPDGTLAGSVLDMAQAVRNAIAWLGVPLSEAARMASAYPADFIGLGATHGRIAKGCVADFVALDAQLQVAATWIGGEAQTYS